MNVDVYERVWMWGAAGIIVTFLGTLAFATVAQEIRPPSHVETIDPKTVWTDARFAERGARLGQNGAITVTAVGMTFAFLPNEIRVPAGRPVTFRMTSSDVVHGFQIVGTNANTMVVPGYVSQFTTAFAVPGEYLIVCNEYCGIGHHGMYGKLIVEPAP